jgi:hypothetical protein
MKKMTIVCLVSLIALAFLVAPVSAKTIRTPYVGSEECGDVITSDGREWFSEDGVYHVRNGWLECTDTVPDEPRVSGDVFLTVNWNFQFTTTHPYGPMWGKIRLDNEGGYWEGIWVGEITELEGYSYIHAVMRGFGDYEGLQARANYFKDSPLSSTYQISGVIMEPGGK